MPIFEEKLICPLAVRFSQDHVRPEFLDKRDIETATKAIKTKPGSGDYDIVLVPPFPSIEVIRGHLKSGDADHWLSLDNRRLYCLQRAAVTHWPLRVAVVVEALRAPTEGMRKKLNSSVDGLSVGIGHSPATLIGRWDWHQEVNDLSETACEGVAQLVALDDAKAGIQDLADAPAPPSMLDLFFQNEKAGDDASTIEPRSSRASEDSKSNDSGDWMPDIVGVWDDGKGNSYTVTIATDDSWTCWRNNAAAGRRKFTLWYDQATDCLSWGDDWSCWADASDIRYDISSMKWYAGRDASKRNPRFQWMRADVQKAAPKQSSRKCNRKKIAN